MIVLAVLSILEAFGIYLCAKSKDRIKVELSKAQDTILELDSSIEILNDSIEEKERIIFELQTVQSVQRSVKGDLMDGWKYKAMYQGSRESIPLILQDLKEVNEPRALLHASSSENDSLKRELEDSRSRANSLQMELNAEREKYTSLYKSFMELHAQREELEKRIVGMVLDKNPAKNPVSEFQTPSEPREKPVYTGPQVAYKAAKNPVSELETEFLAPNDSEEGDMPTGYPLYQYKHGRKFEFKPIIDFRQNHFGGEIHILSKASKKVVYKFHVKDLIPGERMSVGPCGYVILCGMAKYGGCNTISFAPQPNTKTCGEKGLTRIHTGF